MGARQTCSPSGCLSIFVLRYAGTIISLTGPILVHTIIAIVHELMVRVLMTSCVQRIMIKWFPISFVLNRDVVLYETCEKVRYVR